MDIVKIWTKITEQLVKEEKESAGPCQLVEKFNNIFDLKDVYEYKNSICVDPFYSPRQFAYLSMSIRRAFIEGYLLAQEERRKEDAAYLYNCYKDDVKENRNEKDNSKPIIDSIIPRRSVG